MNPRSGVSALTRALGLLGVLGIAACEARPSNERRSPLLSIVRHEGATMSGGGGPPGSIALALGGLPPEALTRLRERLEESTEAALRRAAPMLFDLVGLTEEEDPATAPEPLGEALIELPALTAAANVLGAPWNASGLSVHLGPTCESPASRCVPLFAAGADHGDTLVRRGRALAWTLAYAALLRVAAGSRAALLRSLREAQTRSSTTIALVFGASQGALDEAELELLRCQARRALSHLAPDAPQRPWLDALAAARAGWALPIQLDADEVLVIPRLSVLARLNDFHSEVELARTLAGGFPRESRR
jgi:hypothetical protein